MINKNISIGTVQFAVNTEQNSHLLAEYPIGSISRMFSELISENLNFLGIQSDTASLIISKPEENTTKQLIYTSMLPIETARKIFETEYYDYLLFGELKFENLLKVEITLINRLNDKSFRRELSIKDYDFFNLSINIIDEVLKLIDLDISLDKLKDLLIYSTNNLKSWGWYSLSYEKDLDNDDKILSLEKSLEEFKNFELSKIKLMTTNLDESKNFDLSKALEDTNFNLTNYLANQYELKKEYSISYSLYKESYKKNKDQNNILSKIIKLSYELKKIEEFNLYIKQYVDNTNENTFNYEEIPFYLFLAGEERLALEKLLRGLELKPKSSKINSLLAYIYMTKNELDKADKYYEKAFDLYKNLNILEDWTSVLIKKNDFEKVITLINNYIDDLPSNSGILCNLAISYLAMNNEDKALKNLEKAVKIDKDNPKANSLLGNIYLDKKSFSRAQKYFFLALQIEPNNPIWNINMGNLFFAQDDFEESLKYYNKAKEINNNLNIPNLFICNGVKLEKEGNKQEAINSYIKASKYLKGIFLPIQKMTQIFINENQIDEAVDILEKDYDKFKNNTEFLNMLYELYKSKEKGFFKGKWKKKSEEIELKLNSLKN
ncbi:MAG: tetratricopeptide repeat protein [Candidatus Sericytochromatia bacterium]